MGNGLEKSRAGVPLTKPTIAWNALMGNWNMSSHCMRRKVDTEVLCFNSELVQHSLLSPKVVARSVYCAN